MQSNPVRCAIYTRKSSEEGLEQDFNSLDAQREACSAYITSQRHEGWTALPDHYDDGGFSGGNTNRPALQRLFQDIQQKKVDTIVVYKIDRLTRSLADFAKMVELFDAHKVTFVAVTQQFNTTTSMGRLTLNVLLSFAQFEREVTGERIRDKIAASKAKGMWMGGATPLGYRAENRQLVIEPEEAKLVRHIFARYLALQNVPNLRDELNTEGYRTRKRVWKSGRVVGGRTFMTGPLTHILKNRLYIGEIDHKGKVYPGNHPAILDHETWQAVQDLRHQSSLAHCHRTRAPNSSLLAGLLFDAENRPMSPSHTNKKGKRYRYYVSQADLQGLPSKSETITKIPAGEIDDVVMQRVKGLLGSDDELQSILSGPSFHQRQQGQQLAEEWQELPLGKRKAMVRTLISQVCFSAGNIEVKIAPSRLLDILDGKADQFPPKPSPSDHSLHITIQLKRMKGGPTLLIPADGLRSRRPPNMVLVKAIAKAHYWNHLLLTGKARDLNEIAKEFGTNSRYISKLLPLAWLEKECVIQIMEGNNSADLTLNTLLEISRQC